MFLGLKCFNMGRRIWSKKKYTEIKLYNVSPCMREFIEETAQSRSVQSGRQISMSNVVSCIIRKRMIELGWDCE